MERKYVILLMLTIMILGIITIYSASYVYAYRSNSKVSTDSFINKHLLYLVVGILLMIIFSVVNYNFYKNLLRAFYILLFALLIFTKVYGVFMGYSAARWIKIGEFSFQITEFVKIFIIYYIADYIASNRLKISRFYIGMVRPIAYISPLLLAVFIEPDLGTTIIIFFVTVTMLFIAGAKKRHILYVSIGLLLVVIVVSATFFPYQWERFFHSHTNEQVINGETGIGSGGIIGKGIGKGAEKYVMTQSFTDFIFVTFGEEFGMIGLILILLCYWALFYYILINVRFIMDEFGRFYMIGFALYLFLQVLINISGVLAITPMKGLTVPLLSYGGSSTIATLIGFGIALNIIKNTARLPQ